MIGKLVFARNGREGLYCEVSGLAEWRPVHYGYPEDAPPGAVLAFRVTEDGDVEVHVLADEEFHIIREGPDGMALVGWCSRCPLRLLRRPDMFLPPCMFPVDEEALLQCESDEECIKRVYGEEGLRLLMSLGLPFRVEYEEY